MAAKKSTDTKPQSFTKEEFEAAVLAEIKTLYQKGEAFTVARLRERLESHKQGWKGAIAPNAVLAIINRLRKENAVEVVNPDQKPLQYRAKEEAKPPAPQKGGSGHKKKSRKFERVERKPGNGLGFPDELASSQPPNERSKSVDENDNPSTDPRPEGTSEPPPDPNAAATDEGESLTADEVLDELREGDSSHEDEPRPEGEEEPRRMPLADDALRQKAHGFIARLRRFQVEREARKRLKLQPRLLHPDYMDEELERLSRNQLEELCQNLRRAIKALCPFPSTWEVKDFLIILHNQAGDRQGLKHQLVTHLVSIDAGEEDQQGRCLTMAQVDEIYKVSLKAPEDRERPVREMFVGGELGRLNDFLSRLLGIELRKSKRRRLLGTAIRITSLPPLPERARREEGEESNDVRKEEASAGAPAPAEVTWDDVLGADQNAEVTWDDVLPK